ncbi:hypothetical protein KEM55_004256 [Ascosphaera atra]|nr:hypothetical protein KEM55_004256 [Ascosphaera atra]
MFTTHPFCFIATRGARTGRALARCANAPEEPVPVLGPKARAAGVFPLPVPASLSVPVSAPVPEPATSPMPAPSPSPARSAVPAPCLAPASVPAPVPSPGPAPVPSVSAPPKGGDEFMESVTAAATEPIFVASRSPSVEVAGPSPMAPCVGPAPPEKKKKVQQKLLFEPIPRALVSQFVLSSSEQGTNNIFLGERFILPRRGPTDLVVPARFGGGNTSAGGRDDRLGGHQEDRGENVDQQK